ncbi:MAG: diguanylate cyclase, partial [Candidatus Eremiobacteraeota bacterium]|nr:diguanylate cyclase [Candidatus Eremiobacteraeota bacterium]
MPSKIARITCLTVVLAVILIIISSGAVLAANKAESEKYVNYAKRYLQLEDTYNAIKCLEYAIKQYPKNDRAHALLGDIYFDIPDEAKAEEEYKKAIKLNPKKGSYHTKLGKLYYEYFKDYKKAVPELKKGFHMDTTQHESLYYLGLIKQEEKKYEEAEKYFKKALKLKKKETKYHIALGRLYQELQRWKDSEKEYTTAIESAPRGSEMYTEAKRELASMRSQQRNKNLMALGLRIIPVLVLIIIGLVIFTIIRSRKEAERREEEEYGVITGESLAGVSEDILSKFTLVTRMEYAALFLASAHGNTLDLETVQNMEKGAIKPIDIAPEPLAKWLEKNRGRTFMFNQEKRDPIFLAAFPNIQENIEPLEMRVGAPFIFEQKLLGMLFLGCSKGKDLSKLRKIYERKRNFINRLAVRASGAINEFMQEKIAATDVDTGAYSRAYFDKKILEEIQIVKGYDGFCSILMVEPDNIESIRRKYGDVQVKQMLQFFVSMAKDRLRYNVDTIARFDERRLVIIIPGTDSRGAAMVGESLRRDVEGKKVSEFIPRITISGGVATFPVHGNQVSKLIEISQSALEAAKSQGGNMVMEARRKEVSAREEPVAGKAPPTAVKKPAPERPVIPSAAPPARPAPTPTRPETPARKTVPTETGFVSRGTVETPTEKPPKIPEKLAAIQEKGLTPTPPLKSPFRKRGKPPDTVEAMPKYDELAMPIEKPGVPSGKVPETVEEHEISVSEEKPQVREDISGDLKSPPKPGGFKLPLKGKFPVPFGRRFTRKEEAPTREPEEEIPLAMMVEETPETRYKIPGLPPSPEETEEPLIKLPEKPEKEAPTKKIPPAMIPEKFEKEKIEEKPTTKPPPEKDKKATTTESIVTMESGEEIPLALLVEEEPVIKRKIPGLPEKSIKKSPPIREYEEQEETRTLFSVGKKVTPPPREEAPHEKHVGPALKEKPGQVPVKEEKIPPAEPPTAPPKVPFSLKDLAASLKKKTKKKKPPEAPPVKKEVEFGPAPPTA